MPGVPLKRIGRSAIAKQIKTDHWVVRTPAAGTALLPVRGRGRAIICRISPKPALPWEPDTDVVQLGLGDAATSRLCDSVYVPQTDTAYHFAGRNLSLATVRGGVEVRWEGALTIRVFADYFRKHRDLPYYTPLDRTRFPKPPAGWCSWYEYYLNITEEEIVRNTDWLKANLQDFGCEWVQIDDGWQGRGTGYGTNRDWFKTADKFPKGMKFLADYIRKSGFRPGIWCIPHSTSDDAHFAAEPELFIRKEDGSTVTGSDKVMYSWMPDPVDQKTQWVGKYLIDPTHPKSTKFFKRLFEMICGEWGYEYVKIDGQGGMQDLYAKNRHLLHDPSADTATMYRNSLAVMKKTMGKDRFLLNCLQGFDSAGLNEGMRIGSDISLEAGWDGMQPALRYTFRYLFMNTIAFYTDPDALCVREPLPMNLAKLWTTMIGITGQLLMTSDIMYKLPEERVELLRRIYPVADIHPMELYPLATSRTPRIWDLKVDLPGVGQWDVAALINWKKDAPETIAISADVLGLGEQRMIVWDEDGTLLHAGDGECKVEIAPAACRLISVWPLLDRPAFVGTNRHLTRGAVDVKGLAWNGKTRTLSGESQVVRNDPYEVRVYVPEGWRIASEGVMVKDGIARLTIQPKRTGMAKWSVRFTR